MTSLKLIDAENYCDGTREFGNADKSADCPDQSDEILDICCAGDFPKYDGTLCSKW